MRDVNAASRAKWVRGHRSVALHGMRVLLAACATVLCAVLFLPHGVAAQEPARPRIAFVDLALRDESQTARERRAGVCAAPGRGVIRVKPLATGGWQDGRAGCALPRRRISFGITAARWMPPRGLAGPAPRTSSPTWKPVGACFSPALPESLLNAMGIETAPLHVSTQKARQGSLRVVEKHRAHPFCGGCLPARPSCSPPGRGAVAGLDIAIRIGGRAPGGCHAGERRGSDRGVPPARAARDLRRRGRASISRQPPLPTRSAFSATSYATWRRGHQPPRAS